LLRGGVPFAFHLRRAIRPLSTMATDDFDDDFLADFDVDAFALLFVAVSAALSAASDFLAVVFGAGFAVSAFWASAGGGAATDAKERTQARTRVDKSFMDLNLR